MKATGVWSAAFSSTATSPAGSRQSAIIRDNGGVKIRRVIDLHPQGHAEISFDLASTLRARASNRRHGQPLHFYGYLYHRFRYVGLVTGACLADVGHNVVCVDNDPRKMKRSRPAIRSTAGSRGSHSSKCFAQWRFYRQHQGRRRQFAIVFIAPPQQPDGSVDLSSSSRLRATSPSPD